MLSCCCHVNCIKCLIAALHETIFKMVTSHKRAASHNDKSRCFIEEDEDSCSSSSICNDNSTVQMPASKPPGLKKKNPSHPVIRFQRFCVQSVRHHDTLIRRLVVSFCLFGYVIYLGFAIHHSLYKAVPLLIITGAVIIILLYILIRDNFGEDIYRAVCMPSSRIMDAHWYWLQWWAKLVILCMQNICYIFQLFVAHKYLVMLLLPARASPRFICSFLSTCTPSIHPIKYTVTWAPCTPSIHPIKYTVTWAPCTPSIHPIKYTVTWAPCTPTIHPIKYTVTWAPCTPVYTL